MVPKGLSIFDMEVKKSKGLSWFDNMYQKLEDFCDEMDENSSVFLKETKKYVEKHVNEVGANVRKLCTEVIQDMIPPTSEDDVKKFSSELSIGFVDEFAIFENPKSNSKKLDTANSDNKEIQSSFLKYYNSKISVSDDPSKKNEDLNQNYPVESGVLDEHEKQGYCSTIKGSAVSDNLTEMKEDMCKIDADFTIRGTGDKPNFKIPVLNELRGDCQVTNYGDASEVAFTDTKEISVKNEEGKQHATLQPGYEKLDLVIENVPSADGKFSTDSDTNASLIEFTDTADESVGMTDEDENQSNPRPNSELHETLDKCKETQLLKKSDINMPDAKIIDEPEVSSSQVQPPLSIDAKESFVDVLSDAEEVAFWYETDAFQTQNMVDDSFLAVDQNILRHNKSCDSEWELI